MTDQEGVPSSARVLDAMCLIHFGRAERLDVLRDLLVGKECWTRIKKPSASLERTAWMCTAQYGCSQMHAATASCRSLLLGI
jgi:hypothetical protein